MKRVEKQEAIKLRLQGKSYNEIRKLLDIPSKGTLSYWFKNFPLPPETQKKLARNIELAQKRGLFRFNRKRTKAIEQENRDALLNAKKEINILTKRELLLVGAALYWGEGTKSIRSGGSNGIAIANSDPLLVAIFMRFVREIFGTSEDRIRAGIQVHDNVDIEAARRFWSKVTKLPVDRFYIIKQVSSASKKKRPSNSLPYGTAIIKVNKRVLFYRVRGYIEGLAENINLMHV